jgi:hypothetical protein
MASRGFVGRALVGLGLGCGLVVALAGGVVLHGFILVTVWVAAGLTACVAYGARDGDRAQGLAAARTAAAWTVAVIMLVAGAGVLAGRTVAALMALAAVVQGSVWSWRCAQAWPAAPAGRAAADGGTGERAWTVRLARSEVPVSLLPTSVLGSEWLRTTAALDDRLDPQAREEILRRRQETLDELERRDPAGFGRWLAAGPAPGSDPARFVRGRRTMGNDAA